MKHIIRFCAGLGFTLLDLIITKLSIALLPLYLVSSFYFLIAILHIYLLGKAISK